MIPLIASTIGVCILEFKLKLPWYIKILLPFTYYLFYQYTIVARSYCLIFPALCYLAMLYPKRREKPIAYGLGLLFLAGISLHMSLLSGFLFLLYLGEYVTSRWKDEKSLKSLFKEKKVCVMLFILAIFYCLIIVTLIPKEGIPTFFTNNKVTKLEKAIQVVGESLVSSSESNQILNLFSTIWMISITGILLIRARKDRKIIIVFFPVFLFLTFFYCNQWHIGILTELLFFIWYILYQDKDPEKVQKFEKRFLQLSMVAIFVIQVIWNCQSLIGDIKNIYSQGQNMAIYLQEKVEENKVIYGVDYSVTAILPYFETNIFANYPDPEKSFYHWGSNSGRKEKDSEIYAADADIYVFSEVYYSNRKEIIGKLEEKGYQIKRLSSTTYFKNKPYEFSGYIFLEKKEN